MTSPSCMAETTAPRDAASKHRRLARAFKETFTTLVLLVGVRFIMGERVPTAAVLLKMLVGLMALMFVMEWLDDEACQTVVGVARANTASQVLNVVSR